MQLKNSCRFELTITRDARPLHDLKNAAAQVWHDYEGKVCAYAYKTGKDHWLHFPHVATYRIRNSEDLIAAYPEENALPEKIVDIFTRVVTPIALHVQGTEVLHASAVRTPTGVAAFCGISETGKSTTAFALSQRGYEHWADDAVPFEFENGLVHALPLPFAIRLSEDAGLHLSDPSKSAESSRLPQAGLLSVVFVLKRERTDDSTSAIRVLRLSPPQAFRSVLLHAHFFNLNDIDLKRQMVSNYMRLTSTIPVFEIHFQPGFDKLPALLDALESAIRNPV